MQHFSPDSLASWDRFTRGNFINSLSGFKSTHLIGTTHENGVYNLGLFHNVVHLGADPALVGFVNRPREAAPHTLANIERDGWYTMNAVAEPMVAQAHQCSAKYPSETSEFEAVGLEALLRPECPAPFVAASPVQYAMQLVEVLPIRHNGTFLVVGEVKGVWLQEGLLGPDGFIELEKAGVVTSSGIDSYHNTRLIRRFPYAKP